jgi:RimJ/RimL family protein N-acetyltransferase
LIETPRLILRPWRQSDLALFAELNADPAVMRLLGGALSREESDAYVRRAEAHFADHGFCKWAVGSPMSGSRHRSRRRSRSHGDWIADIGGADMRPKQRWRRLTMDSGVLD